MGKSGLFAFPSDERLPESWGLIPLKYLFRISKEPSSEPNPTVLSLARAGVRVRDITNNEGQIAASYENYNVIRPGDLLLNPMDLYSGANCSLSEVQGVISPAYVNLRPIKSLNPKYYDYFFKIQYWTMALFAHGKGVSFDNRWTINADSVLNYVLPFPPKKVQDTIVGILNKKCFEIDELISVEERQIERLKEYLHCVIDETVCGVLIRDSKKSPCGLSWISSIPSNWQIRPLKTLFTTGKGLPITKADLAEDGVAVISYGQIHAKYNNPVSIDERLFRFVSSDYLQTNSESLTNVGDFIFADTSEDVAGSGDFVHVDKGGPIFAGYHTIVLKSKMPEFSPYLAYLFMSSRWKTQIQSEVSGVKLFSISKGILMGATVILPPIDEQIAICIKLDAVNEGVRKIVEIKLDKIEALRKLKKSLIYEYVTGKKEVA